MGDVAGMGADIFESYAGGIIATIAIAATLPVEAVIGLTSDGGNVEGYRNSLMAAPLILSALGLLSSFIGIKSMDKFKEKNPATALHSSTLLSAGLFLLLAAVFIVAFSPLHWGCLLYTSPSPRDATLSRMPSSA